MEFFNYRNFAEHLFFAIIKKEKKVVFIINNY
jgi:hypothetical protein